MEILRALLRARCFYVEEEGLVVPTYDLN